MKLTTALLLLTCLQVSARVFSQTRITLKLQSTELKKALSIIERKSSYRFLYNDETVKSGTKVDIDANDTPVTEVLDKLFANRQLSYKILENNLVVITGQDVEVKETKITGKVVSSTGEVMTGVSVKVKGSTLGAQTDGNGNFSLTVPDDAVLVFSYVGYVSQEITVAGKSSINVSLVASTQKMDEVVVIGYGTANKRDLTGSITKVLGKDIADKPNTNPVSSLQGKVAGLSVVNNGVPGQTPDIRIRGTVSIGSTHPLYVVNGIFNDNIDFLNPNDIESIEVLKDPSSLAIFGVKGASGVIAITTKQAKAGQLIVNFNTTFGQKTLVDKIKLASGTEFRSIFAQEAANGLNDPDPSIGQKNTDFLNNELPKWTGNTDWVDALTRKAGFNTTNISLSSATDKNKFYLGAGYTNDEGLVKHVKYEKINFNVNEEVKVSNKLKFGFNFIGSREVLPYGSDQLDDARRTLPIINSATKSIFAKNPYGNDSANYNIYEGVPVIQNTEHNPLMVVENEWNKVKDVRWRILPTLYGEYNILKNLSFRATVYADIQTEDKREYTPLYYSYNPSSAAGIDIPTLFHKTTSLTQNGYNTKSFQGDYIFNYKTNVGDHSFNATAGFTHYYFGFFQTTGRTIQQASDVPIPDDSRLWYISSGFGTPSSPTSAQHEYATVSGLVRVLYNYKSKYYINGSFRRDGASGINSVYSKKFQNFWAIGAAWELTKEKFLENQNMFNYIKLKGSVGVLGNFNTLGNDYPAYPGLGYTNAQFGGNTVTVANPNYLVDPNLQWEQVNSQEVGVEFSAFSNRLHGEINYYDKKTKNLLAFLKPSGVSPTLTNSGEISNQGFELAASWNQKISNDFSVTVSGNLTTYKNNVVKLNYPTPSPIDPQVPNQAKEGYPIGSFFGYIVEGIYQSYSDILKSPVYKGSGTSPAPGDLKYKDLNGDNVIDDKDQKMMGNPTPDFAYGGNVTFHFKGFDLGVDVGGVYGNEIYRYWGTSEQKNSVYNYPQYYTQAWHGEGTSNWVPIVDAQHTINRVPSTYGIEDGSYFRIRNLQLGYNISTGLLSRAHIKSFRIFANVQNLKTWKNNIGYSPEYGGDAFSFGIDRGNANGALPRIITGGINVTF
jgi:TonB-linked SusC/RagA family outer membrane protein